jgi:hypothetical protein
LNRLSLLDLTGASVYNVSELAFRGLRRLRVLKIGKNALDTLPALVNIPYFLFSISIFYEFRY